MTIASVVSMSSNIQYEERNIEDNEESGLQMLPCDTLRSSVARVVRLGGGGWTKAKLARERLGYTSF